MDSELALEVYSALYDVKRKVHKATTMNPPSVNRLDLVLDLAVDLASEVMRDVEEVEGARKTQRVKRARGDK